MPKKKSLSDESGTVSETSDATATAVPKAAPQSPPQNSPGKLIESLRSFQLKVEQTLTDLTKQNDASLQIKQPEKLFKWLTKMNDYLRNLVSGFRARLLAPMATLPEMRQKQAPLSASLSLKQAKDAPAAVDLHRIFLSLKISVLVVPELLLISHLFSSNQIFCNSLSELLMASEKDLWHDPDGPLTEKNCHLHLPRMIEAVERLLTCCRIASDWLQQHQDELDKKPLEVSKEVTRLQRLQNCQKLLKQRLEIVAEELSASDFELSEATADLQPLIHLQDSIQDLNQHALGVSDSVEQTYRRIKAIETEILSISKPKNKHRSKDLPPLQLDGEVVKQQDPLTMSQVCLSEIGSAKKRLKFLEYLHAIALEDVDEACMIMPFVVRQADHQQTSVDRLESSLEEKRSTFLHLQNTLAFISQEAECAQYLAGQVNLNGFTAGLGGSMSVASSLVIADKKETDNGKHHEHADRSHSLANAAHPPVVYIKRRHHSQISSQPSSDNRR